eukprot:m.125723 g.125723  ORF g.125723 m.125723 type:complete len:291 (-) comp22150_c0_seq1:439-1311(-)
MPVPIRRRSSRKRTIQTINEATGFDADFLNFSPGLADFAIASGLPLADSQELDSQDLVGAALYANGLFLDSALGEPPSELDERNTSEIPKLPELPAPPVALGPEDEQSVNSEVAMVRRRKEVKNYAAENRVEQEMYGEKNAFQWGGDLAHYRKLAMHQQGKLKPITISDADLRRLSYVPREHALRKGSASLARFRTSYAPLFELCDDAVVADQFLLFLRRKLNDKIEKHAMKQRKTEKMKKLEKTEKKIVTENKFLRERVSRLEKVVVKSGTAGPPVAGKRLRKIKSMPF